MKKPNQQPLLDIAQQSTLKKWRKELSASAFASSSKVWFHTLT